MSVRETKPPVCCAPERRELSESHGRPVPGDGVAESPQASGLVELDGGHFLMGAEDEKGSSRTEKVPCGRWSSARSRSRPMP